MLGLGFVGNEVNYHLQSAQTQKLNIMIAVYYAIYEFNEISQIRGEVIEEGIVSNTKDKIYPRQTSDYPNLPYECELHHFMADGFRIETCNFTITRDFIKQFRTTGDRIS